MIVRSYFSTEGFVMFTRHLFGLCCFLDKQWAKTAYQQIINFAEVRSVTISVFPVDDVADSS